MSAHPTTSDSEHEPDSEHLGWQGRLDVLLFLLVSLAAAYVFALLSYSLYSQLQTYATATQRAISDPSRGDVVVLAFTRAADFAIVKTSVVLLGFILAFFGALYVLRTASVGFKMRVGVGHTSGSLDTSSPGLVMVALGIVTINCALFVRTSVDIDALKNLPQIKLSPTSEPQQQAFDAKAAENRSISLPPFPKGSDELTNVQKQILDSVAQELASNPTLTITIPHQPDDSEMSTEYNLALSDRRKTAINNYLLRLTSPSSRVRITTFGKQKPSLGAERSVPKKR